MGTLPQELIQNTALILTLALVYNHVERRLRHAPPIIGQLITGCLFGIFAIARALLPYRLSPELVVDGRVVMVAMSAMFGGCLAALAAAGFASLPTLIAGGSTMLLEIGIVLVGAAGGVLVYWRWRERVRQFGPLPFLLFGLCLLLVDLGGRLIFPAARTSLPGMLPILILIDIFEVGALGTVLAHQLRRAGLGEALHKSEERYRRLFEESIDAIVVTDLDGNVLSANPAAGKLVGQPDLDQFIGANVSDYHPVAPDRASFQKDIEREGFLRDYELALRRLDGTPITCLVSTVARRDQAGKTIGYLNLLRDVTEQKRMQQQLGKREAHFREIFEQAAFGIVLTDHRGHALESNPAFQKIVGYSADELREMSFTAYTHPDDIERNLKFFQEMLSGQTDRYQIEKRFIRKDGKVIWARLAVSLVKGNGGQDDHVLTVSEDITEQKRVQDALLESEQRFSRLAYNSPDTICIIDVQADQIVYFNRDDFLGYSRKEIEEGIILEAIHPDEQAMAQDYREEVTKEDADIEDTVEYRVKRKDGKWEWIEQRTTILSYTDDRVPVQILLTLRVITDRKRTEQVLLASQNELMAQSASLTALNAIADMVHRSLDFRTVANRALDSLMEYTGAPGASILDLDLKTGKLNMISSRGTGDPTQSLSLIISLNRLAATSQQIISTDDLAQDKQADIPSQRVMTGGKFKSAVCIPLVFQQETLGTITLFFETVYQPATSERETLLAIGRTIALAIANARQVARIEAEVKDRQRAEEAERKQRALAEALTDITTTLTGTLDQDEVLDRILEDVGQVVLHDAGCILLIDGEDARIVRHRGYSPALSEFLVNMRIPLETANIKHMLETGKPCLIPDTREYEGWVNFGEGEWLRSTVGAPIHLGDEMIGFVSLDSNTPGFFGQVDADRLQVFANQASVAIRNARLYESERKQLRLAQTLQSVGALLTSQMSLEEVLNRILDLLAEVVQYDSVSVQLFDEDGLIDVIIGRGFPDSEASDEAAKTITEQTCETRWKHQDVIVISDTDNDDRWITWEGFPNFYIKSWVGAALRVKGELIGTLNVDSATPNAFDESIVDTVIAFANQAAIAIQNARLTESERKQLRLSETLQEVGSLLTSQMSLDDVFERIFDLLGRVLDYDSVGIHLLEGDMLQVIAGRGYPDMEDTRSVAKQVVSRTVKERWTAQSVMVIPDTWADDRWVLDEDMPNRYIRSWIGAALRVKGELIGTLNVDSATPNAYDESLVDTVLAFANQAAIAIQNARLFAESQERNRQLALLNELTRIGTAVLELQELVQMLADTVAKLIQADGCYIILWDEENRRVIMAGAHGPVPDLLVGSAVESGETTLTEAALNLGHALVVEDFEQSPYINRRLTEGYQPSAVVALPLQANERDLGALILGYGEPSTFSDDYLAWAGQVANLVALAIDKAKAYADLEERVEERTTELRELSIRLLELTRLKDEFVSNVSHELRTPITSIKLYHQLLRQRPERYAIYLERLDRESERLEFIVEDLLYLSRMEQGQLPFNSTPADLNKLIDMYFLDRKLLIEKEGHRLAIELADDLPPVTVDQMLMERVLNILVNNALNYTPQGGQITVSTGTDEEWVLLCVSDTGPGIPPDELTHLFERFFRGEASRRANVPGTGLGLAIAKEIVDRHEGQIDVSSKPGEGTTFTIRLPAAGKE